MKRVFVFQDFKSQKFWSIEVVGTDVTVNYGIQDRKSVV